jgi:hypothetical protein
MLLDGFVSTAIAARFAGAQGPQELAMAKTLIVFCSTSIRFLMPLGESFQAAAMLSWATILLSGQGLRRAVGVFGSVSAILLTVALLVAPAILAPHVLLIGIGIQVIWYLALAVLLMRM